MNLALRICDRWLASEKVGKLLRPADRADVASSLGEALTGLFVRCSDWLCNGNAVAVVEALLGHLLDAVSAPIPLGEDVASSMISIAVARLCEDRAFKRLIAITAAPASPPECTDGPVKYGSSNSISCAGYSLATQTFRSPELHGLAACKVNGFNDIPDTPKSASTMAPTFDFAAFSESEMYPSSRFDSDEKDPQLPAKGAQEDLTDPESTRHTIVFDWDDTLLPTKWIFAEMAPALCGAECEDLRLADEPLLLATRAGQEMSASNSKFRRALEEHALVVETILRTARAKANVAIVTLAQPIWFERSFEFFPGLDMQALIKELGIQVFCASWSGSSGSPEALIAAKQVAMAEVFRAHSPEPSTQWNVLSIGDQLTEREAIKKCCRCAPLGGPTPICKTVLLKQEPSLSELTRELRHLDSKLKSLATHGASADWMCSPRGITGPALEERTRSFAPRSLLSPLVSSMLWKRATA